MSGERILVISRLSGAAALRPLPFPTRPVYVYKTYLSRRLDAFPNGEVKDDEDQDETERQLP